MRIISLLPSATEIVYLLGLQDSLVGVTHECDYPPDALNKPRLVESVFPNDCKDMAPGEVDAAIGAAIRSGAPVYRFKPGALEAAKPDIVLAQGLCDVCAVPYRMFDRFTDRARKVMSFARQEAERFNHDYIGTEHILLGLVKE